MDAFKEMDNLAEKASKELIDQVERKLKAHEKIEKFRSAMGNLDEWRPLGDCPLFGKIPEAYIFDCRANNMKHCNINNTKCRRFK